MTTYDINDLGELTREMYFPTYVFFRDFPDAEKLNADILPHIYKWRENDPEGIVRSNYHRAGAWHSQIDMADRPEYGELVNRILYMGGELSEHFGYHPDWRLQIDNMWANISPRNGFNRGHIHPNSHWSGVYYVKAPKDAGRIYFIDPRAQSQMSPMVYGKDMKERPESWSEVYFEPVEGRIILFPSWLFHEVEPNLSELEGREGERVSISFNLWQQKVET